MDQELDEGQRAVSVVNPVDLRVGFVGLGAMGSPMVANLLSSGLPVSVFDVRSEAVHQVMALGARAATSAAEVAATSDVIGISVVDDAQVLDVVRGDTGLLTDLKPGSVVIIHSTVSPQTCRHVERLCRERGADCLDVAVSGFPEKATSGELTLMIGGDRNVIGGCGRYLDAIGSHQFHVGAVGAGVVAKLANNVMWKLAMVGIYEGLNVARAGGLDLASMADVAMASSGNSEALRRWRETGIAQDFPADRWEGGITVGEDRILSEALSIAQAGHIELPVISAVLDMTRHR
jgi:3-hydroxyisobutyrate dehydrogenase-like beta-hydroxyacid dehydrogenase